MIEKGDKIKVEYEGKFEDGNVFDSSEKHGQPLEFVAGTGQVVPGFDNAVLGMKEGEEKEITIEPKDGYGDYNKDLEREIPRDMLPKDQEPKPGMALMLGSPDGKQFPAVIKEVSKDKVKLDLNHPLAGKKLIFKMKIVNIEKQKGEGIESKI